LDKWPATFRCSTNPDPSLFGLSVRNRSGPARLDGSANIIGYT
jgi:hypothetical protein